MLNLFHEGKSIKSCPEMNRFVLHEPVLNIYHRKVAKEMKDRGLNHNSPLQIWQHKNDSLRNLKHFDVKCYGMTFDQQVTHLLVNCVECRKIMMRERLLHQDWAKLERDYMGE
jgi:hypothetical protein